MAPYSATKVAVIGLTKSIGKKVATERARVNAVTPAVIETPLLKQLTDAQVDYMVRRILMGRTARFDEASAVAYSWTARNARL